MIGIAWEYWTKGALKEEDVSLLRGNRVLMGSMMTAVVAGKRDIFVPRPDDRGRVDRQEGHF